MEERKRTKVEERAYSLLLGCLHAQERWMEEFAARGVDLPAVPETPDGEKVKVTVAFHSDVVKWFRSHGQGYHARMNAVLRAYARQKGEDAKKG